MISKFAAAATAALLFSCSATRPPATRPPAALPTAGIASRVVLVSFDGLAADELPLRPELQTMAKLEREGFFVPRVVPVTPSATSVAHVAMITGADPNVTGIVANRFHMRNTPWSDSATGFTADINAETLLESAHRAGKRVGSIAFPSVDFRGARRSADWGLSFVEPLTASRMIHLGQADFHAEWVPPGWTRAAARHLSYSPVMRARIEWNVADRAKQDVDIAAYDTTDDHARNYDTFYIETPAGESRPDHGWFAVSTRLDDGLYGSWSKITRADPGLNDVTIYWGPVMHNIGYPESFRQMIDGEIGFWPAPPDEGLAAAGQAGGDGIDGRTFAEQNDRLTRFLADATALAIRRMPFDLLLSYQPGIDSAEHQFLVIDDRQTNVTPIKRAEGEMVRSLAFAGADRTAATIGSTLDPSKDALIITGDHGLAPAFTGIYLGRLLAGWSLAHDWTVFASGNVAHFYRTGSADSTSRLVASLKATGWFEEIVTRGPSTSANAGDVVAYSYPSIGLSPAGGNGEIAVKPLFYGQHGGLATHHEFHTALIAWGAGVRQGVLAQARQTQIARFVSQLLGIAPPKNAE